MVFIATVIHKNRRMCGRQLDNGFHHKGAKFTKRMLVLSGHGRGHECGTCSKAPCRPYERRSALDTSALLGVFYFRQSDDLVPLCCQAQMENPLPPGASFSISRPALMTRRLFSTSSSECSNTPATMSSQVEAAMARGMLLSEANRRSTSC